MSGQRTPFTLTSPDDALADLRERLARTRFPDQAPGEPWAYGTDVACPTRSAGSESMTICLTSD